MEFIEFTNNELVNIKTMDSQHKEMVDIVNKLFSYFQSDNKSDFKKTFNDLLKLLSAHFEYEEKLMKETHFEGYYSHKLEHDRFLRKLNKINLLLSKNKFELDNNFFINTKNWFFNHLELNDKKCGEYFVKMGYK